MSDDPRSRLRENATEVATTVVTGLWIAALVTGQSWWLGALLFGYIVVVPLVALLFGDEEDQREWWDDDWWGSWDEWWGESDTDADANEPTERSTPADNRDALETLRNRYAAGELTDEQFERKLDRLLETETLEDADRWRRERRNERSEDLEFETRE